jgi:hypothetical protein
LHTGGSIMAQTGTGNDSVLIFNTTFAIGGGITAKLGAGNDTFNLTGAGSVKGLVSENKTGFPGNNIVTVGGNVPGPLHLLGGLKLAASSVALDTNTVSLSGVTVAGATAISLGNGATTININDILATGAVGILTGAGADTINIETANTLAESVFNSIVKISTGAGNDNVAIGGGTVAKRAVFNAKLLLDGGAGTDTVAGVKPADATPILPTGNTFAILPAPVNFETIT